VRCRRQALADVVTGGVEPVEVGSGDAERDECGAGERDRQNLFSGGHRLPRVKHDYRNISDQF
jgi:hypothetical protein